MSKQKPEIVCVCGSSRFCDEIAVWKWEQAKKGIVAIGLYFLPDWYMPVEHHGAEFQGVADTLDALHLQKIDLSDRVFVYNKNDYIGERTAFEIKYAEKQGKPIGYLEPLTVSKGE